MRQHDELPRYVKAFDVGIVPYRLTEYTANVYPTKLNEYLAMGIPVVATDLPEIRRFNAEHGGIVSIAAGAGAFAAAIRQALQRPAPEVIERRVAVAHTNSWQNRIVAMSGLIDEAIERRAAPSSGGTRRCGAGFTVGPAPVAQIVSAVLACTSWRFTPTRCGGPPRR